MVPCRGIHEGFHPPTLPKADAEAASLPRPGALAEHPERSDRRAPNQATYVLTGCEMPRKFGINYTRTGELTPNGVGYLMHSKSTFFRVK